MSLIEKIKILFKKKARKLTVQDIIYYLQKELKIIQGEVEVLKASQKFELRDFAQAREVTIREILLTIEKFYNKAK